MRQLDLTDAYAARDTALSEVEERSDGQDRAVVDQAIAEFARRGEPFSANSIRPLLPEVRRALIGARFRAAANRGDIRRVGYEPSTEPSTHGHPIAVWISTGAAR